MYPHPVRRNRRHARRRLDHATSLLLRSLPDACSRAVFTDLCRLARQRSALLAPASLPAHGEPQLELLRNVAAAAGEFVRTPETWPGAIGSAHDAAVALTEHLLAPYPVPRVLHRVWHGGMGDDERRARGWFVAHAHGTPLRRLDLPLRLTRSMERHFLSSPHDLTLAQALRRAELLAFGAEPEFARIVVATRMGDDLTDGAFWRTVSHWLANAQHALTAEQVGAIVDFVHGVRFQNIDAIGPDGPVVLAAPQPDFAVQGRTPASMLRLVETWHRSLARAAPSAARWAPSPWQALTFVREPGVPAGEGRDAVEPLLWEMVERCSAADLVREGLALHHCVASYTSDCRSGRARIWSLQSRRGRVVRPLTTIEVRPAERAIVQVRGMRNAAPTRACAQVITTWAQREGLVFRT